ncbi:MAG: hypothetical protein NC231_10925 [Bacillus sp. (in: Bacteria)]|nr:hypothetical protein [Bacillus sp. (in: firmicutes)]MCM1427338.1 hypothetical protein [Eubacterium sp.]
MLNSDEVLMKIYELPQVFNRSMANKDYPQAKCCYDTARTVALFMELDEEQMKGLFGERGERGAIIRTGLFSEEKVQKAYLECIKKDMTYENRQYMVIP